MIPTTRTEPSKAEIEFAAKSHLEAAIESGRYAMFIWRIENGRLIPEYDVWDFPTGDYTQVMSDMGKAISAIMRSKVKGPTNGDGTVEQVNSVLPAEGANTEDGNGQSKPTE